MEAKMRDIRDTVEQEKKEQLGAVKEVSVVVLLKECW